MCLLRLLHVVVPALFQAAADQFMRFAFPAAEFLRLAGVVRVALVGGNQFCCVHLDFGVRPVFTLDRDFELLACLLLGGVGRVRVIRIGIRVWVVAVRASTIGLVAVRVLNDIGVVRLVAGLVVVGQCIPCLVGLGVIDQE